MKFGNTDDSEIMGIDDGRESEDFHYIQIWYRVNLEICLRQVNP